MLSKDFFMIDSMRICRAVRSVGVGMFGLAFGVRSGFVVLRRTNSAGGFAPYSKGFYW